MPHCWSRLARPLQLSSVELQGMNALTRPIAMIAGLAAAALLSVPLAMFLAAVGFGLRKRETWVPG